MQQIAVVDFGTGNLRSVHKAIEHVAPGAQVEVTRDPLRIGSSDHVVLPGQGAMGSWLNALETHSLRPAIADAIARKPVLGICLGLQALTRHSEEDGGVEGMGFFMGTVRRFQPGQSVDGVDLKIPHMGWNQVRQTADHPLWHAIPDLSRFYFVHSYYADFEADDEIAGQTDYICRFVSAAFRDNVFAVQFHPEKSHTQGLQLLKNFVNWRGD